MYLPSVKTFGVVQQLDIDRIVSLTNLVINGTTIYYTIIVKKWFPFSLELSVFLGDTFLAAATFTGKVRIYRLIQGQGFRVEQAFKFPGVRSITGYSIRNETFLAAATESRMAIFVARLRGFQKPSIKLWTHLEPSFIDYCYSTFEKGPMPILKAIFFPLLINVVLYKKMCSTNEISVHMSISFFQELFFYTSIIVSPI